MNLSMLVVKDNRLNVGIRGYRNYPTDNCSSSQELHRLQEVSTHQYLPVIHNIDGVQYL